MSIRTRTSGIIVSVNVLPAVSYTGPGDYVSGAAFWGGLRAYSSAQTSGTTKAIQVNSSVSGDQDIFILTTGNLDWATLNSLGGTVVLKKIYDQSGAGLDLSLRAGTGSGATMRYQPAGLGSGVGSWDSTSSGDYLSAGTLAFVEGMATSAVLQAPSAGTPYYWGDGTTGKIVGDWRTSNLRFEGSTNNANFFFQSATSGNYASVINNYNGANSQVFVNGSGGATATDGVGLPVTDTFDWGAAPTIAQWSNPGLCEFGIWLSGIFSGTQVTNMYNNQKSFWGFP